MKSSNLSALHDIAMEFAEEARFASKRGEEQTAKLFYQKAFSLEKTYALAFPSAPQYLFSKAVLLRSAAHLAINSGYIQEAMEFAKLGLETHPDFTQEFQAIIQEGKTSKKEVTEKVNIQGILIFADLSKQQIKIQTKEDNRLYTIFVPNSDLENLVLLYWAQPVMIKASANKNGQIQLDEIKKAA